MQVNFWFAIDHLQRSSDSRTSAWSGQARLQSPWLPGWLIELL